MGASERIVGAALRGRPKSCDSLISDEWGGHGVPPLQKMPQ